MDDFTKLIEKLSSIREASGRPIYVSVYEPGGSGEEGPPYRKEVFPTDANSMEELLQDEEWLADHDLTPYEGHEWEKSHAEEETYWSVDSYSGHVMRVSMAGPDDTPTSDYDPDDR